MPHKLLIIDDSELMHDMLIARLSGEAMEIHTATTGEAGIALAMKHLPDLILLDVDLGTDNGYDICRRLKDMAQTRHIMIIFLTGASSVQEKIKGLNLGAMDYITKPFDQSELEARVTAALRTRRLVELLERKAMVDGLTGLWNRSYLDMQVEALLALSARTGEGWSCLMIDVDHFKSINDTHGHMIGDCVLQHVAAVIGEGFRGHDIVCRYGGEEFAVLLPQTDLAGAHIVAERIRKAVAGEPVSHGKVTVSMTCSIGVAEHLHARDGIISPIARADKALYQAKQSGRNRCVASMAEEQKIIAA